MKRGRNGILLLSLYNLILVACSGGAGGPASELDPSENSSQSSLTGASNNAPGPSTSNFLAKDAEPRESLKKYATSLHADVTKIEEKFAEILGPSPQTDFNDAWLKFFMTTDPAFVSSEAYLSDLWKETYSTMTTSALPVRTVNNPGGEGEGAWVSKTYPDGSWASYRMDVQWSAKMDPNGNWASSQTFVDNDPSKEEDERKEKDRKARAHEMLAALNAQLLLIRSRLAEDAAIFQLKIQPAASGALVLPEASFAAIDNLEPEFKEPLAKLLVASSFNAPGGYYSYFQFAGEPANASHRHHRGRAVVNWVAASENPFVKNHAPTE